MTTTCVHFLRITFLTLRKRQSSSLSLKTRKLLKKTLGNKRRTGNKSYSEVYVRNAYVLHDCKDNWRISPVVSSPPYAKRVRPHGLQSSDPKVISPNVMWPESSIHVAQKQESCHPIF